jgi:hypothetical protein
MPQAELLLTLEEIAKGTTKVKRPYHTPLICVGDQNKKPCSNLRLGA